MWQAFMQTSFFTGLESNWPNRKNRIMLEVKMDKAFLSMQVLEETRVEEVSF